MPNTPEYLIQRNRHRLKRLTCVNPATGCWHWTGARMPDGLYGQVRRNGKKTGAHREAYRAWVGEPGDLFVCHKCDNPICINPDHLFLGTNLDNMQDAVRKGRTHHKNATHCKNGHPFSGDNLVMQGTKRRCRECSRARFRKHYAKRVAQGAPSPDPRNGPDSCNGH